MTTQQQSQQPQAEPHPGLTERVAKVEGTLEQMDKRLDGVEKRLDGLEKRLSSIDYKLTMLIFGSWITLLAAILGSRFLE